MVNTALHTGQVLDPIQRLDDNIELVLEVFESLVHDFGARTDHQEPILHTKVELRQPEGRMEDIPNSTSIRGWDNRGVHATSRFL
jgi:hypothetical protein